MATRRIEMALECIPKLFRVSDIPMRILYIGAHHKEIALIPQLKAAGHNVSLLEIVPNYAKRFMKGGMSEGIFYEVYVGDVLNIQYVPDIVYDATVWWHGPEHIERSQFSAVIDEIEFKTKQLVVLACPWGDSKMYSTKVKCTERDSMRHLSKLYPDDFELLGYSIETIGIPDGSRHGAPSHILAWKWMSHD